MNLSIFSIISFILLTLLIVLIIQTARLVLTGRKIMALTSAPDISLVVTMYSLLKPGKNKTLKTYFNIITDRERKSFVKISNALNNQTQAESDALNAHLDLCIKTVDEYIKPYLIEELVVISDNFNEYKFNAVELVSLIERDLTNCTCVSRYTPYLIQYVNHNNLDISRVMDIVKSVTPCMEKDYIESKISQVRGA